MLALGYNQTYSDVKAALDEWADSYIRRDIRRLLSCIAPDDDVVMYGTGADEKRIGLNAIRTQAERDWAQTDASAFVLQAHFSLPAAQGEGESVPG